MKKLFLGAFCSAYALPLPALAPFTHQNATLNPLEQWRSAQTLGLAPLAFDFEHSSEVPADLQLPYDRHLSYAKGQDSLAASALLASTWRGLGQTGDDAQAWDGGVRLWGRKGPLSFWTDARIYTEFHDIEHAPSFDREFVERQNAGTNGIHNSYISYARYRGAIELSGAYGHLGFRRDPVVWGPGSFYNLAFSAYAVPFAHLYYQAQIGPIRVTSLWGRLNIPGNKEFGYSDKTRSMYAHRYEWAPTANLSLGLSEQLVTYESEAFAALMPIVPLFMEKGQILEENNNGNLSFDLSYRFHPGWMVYGEFFLDDLQEPTSLFNDFWGNRWAAMAGLRSAHSLGSGIFSQVLEWSRVEPWVYSHYYANTAQTSSRGYPLGNILGPNSMGLSYMAYYRWPQHLELGLHTEWTWKGTDHGSNQEDPIYTYQPNTKTFLSGAYGPNWTISPSVGYKWKWIWLQSRLGLRDGPMDYQARLMVEY